MSIRSRRTRVSRRLRARARSLGVLALLAMVTAVAGLPPANATFSANTATSTSFTADSLAAPTSLGATGTPTVTLSWTATTSSSASGTRVFRGTASGGPYSQIAQIAGLATTSTTDAPGTGTFYYVVEAYYNGGGANWTSPDSNQASITITPTPAFVKLVGTATCGATSNTVTVPAGGVAAGNTLILRAGFRSSSTGAVTASDSRGNSYTVDINMDYGTQYYTATLSAHVTTALLQNDTVTVSFPNSSSSNVVVSEFSGIATSNRVDVTNTGWATSSTSSPISLTTTNASDLIYAAAEIGGAPTVTDPAGWTAANSQTVTCGGAPGNSASAGGYRIVSSTGTYTYTPTLNQSQNWATTAVAYKAG